MAKTAFKGTPVTLAGEFVKAGTSAPEFTLVKGDLSNYTLKDGKGKYLILNIFPSMDTGVCATSVRKNGRKYFCVCLYNLVCAFFNVTLSFQCFQEIIVCII